MQGELLSIAVRAKPRAPMRELSRAMITIQQGVADDARGRPGPRQVTVMAAEDWDAACKDLGRKLPWTSRRANLLVKGIPLRETIGDVIQVGDVRLLVTGETDPCSRMDEIESGLCSALVPGWRGGVCCRVLRGGEVSVSLPVELVSEAESAAKDGLG